MPEDLPESLRARVERIYRYEVTVDPNARALAEDKDLVGTTLTPHETFMLAISITAGVRVALFDLAEQLDTLLGPQAE